MSEVKGMEKVVEENGYLHYTELENGRDACLHQLAFTWAILADLTYCGYGDRWCYHTYEDAYKALLAWGLQGGDGEPQGWHRNPSTGRRRENGDPNKEIVNW